MAAKALNTKTVMAGGKAWQVNADAAESCEMLDLIVEYRSESDEIKRVAAIYGILDILVVGGAKKVRKDLAVGGFTPLEAVGELCIELMEGIQESSDKAKNSQGSHS